MNNNDLPGYDEWLESTGLTAPLSDAEAAEMEAEYQRATLESNAAAAEAEEFYLRDSNIAALTAQADEECRKICQMIAAYVNELKSA